jgi:hypothetical protein
MSAKLLEPVLTGGIKNSNFFNGRLLSADALRDEQDANRRQHWQLGDAIGAGIVSGLSVSPSTLPNSKNVVQVSAGLALNRSGQALAIAANKDVELVGTASSAPADAGLFGNCGQVVAVNITFPTTVYILALAPASGYEGSAPMHGLTDQGSLNSCGKRYAVEGARFKLAGVNTSAIPGLSAATQTQLTGLLSTDDDDPARLSRLQNLLAHLCFGSETLASFAVDPFRQAGGQSAFASYGLVDAAGLADCDVPLALIHLTAKGARIVDNWAVRRRVLPEALSGNMPLPGSQRRLAEGEAIFLQFQEQIGQLVQKIPGTVPALMARHYFRYLPPVGLLPLNNAHQAGFDALVFFNGLPAAPPSHLEGGLLLPLVQVAYHFPPIDLDQRPGLWIYRVSQNDQAVRAGGTALPYLVFTSGLMSAPSADRLDINRWDYFNFA